MDGTDRVTVEPGTDFSSGDTALLIQMKGSEIDPSTNTLVNMNNVGRYEIIIIESVTGTEIKFRSNIINTYDAGQGLQLVRVPSYSCAKVTGTLTCSPWNGSSGGILALIVSDTLELAGDMDVSAKGFRGGEKTWGTSNCYQFPSQLNYLYAASDSAGFKGESMINSAYPYKRGRGGTANGGGGGNGFGSGGGGGAGYGSGGSAGQASGLFCGSIVDLGGFPGEAPKDYFDGRTTDQLNRIFAGGGGGAGTGINENDISKGGNGGGIVFLIASYIKSGNYSVRANGESVMLTASNQGGNGGGGGGGSIIFAVDQAVGQLNVEALGGKGGNTANYCSGQGGGGGGGFFWHSGQSFSGGTVNTQGGQPGIRVNTKCEGTIPGFSGGTGDSANYLNPVLNGFLFNGIKQVSSVCFGEAPGEISGSVPKGGNGQYSYSWQKRDNSSDHQWITIPGADKKNYSPPALSDTTDYRRIVMSRSILTDEIITDTSKWIRIEVNPEIKNNFIISADTVVCSGQTVILKGTVATGGNPDKSFTYQWELSSDSSSWLKAQNNGTAKDFSYIASQPLKYLRRIAKNGNCEIKSNTSRIDILPKISNNISGVSQTVCYNSKPMILEGSSPAGGTGSYRYRWMVSVDLVHFNPTGTGDTSLNYSPGRLTSMTYYRRMVYSGPMNTCSDSGSVVKIKLLPAIQNNRINSNQTLCEGSKPAAFTGTVPSGGDDSYRYQWEIKSDNNIWSALPSSNTTGYQSGLLNTSGYFRRIVFSGQNDCCSDTTSAILVTVQPKIGNNSIAGNQDICAGSIPLKLTQKEGLITGGSGSYAYQWMERNAGSTVWNNCTNGNELTFQPGTVLNTKYYRRKILSGACTDLSDSVRINTLPVLTNNFLQGNQEICEQSSPGKITGSFVSGGNNSYRYEWQDSVKNGSWETIPDSLSKDLFPGLIIKQTSYRRIIKSGPGDCCISISPVFTIRVNPLPTAEFNNSDTLICAGTNAKIQLAVNSGTSPYKLTVSNDLNDITSNINANGITPVEFIPVSAGSYYIKELSDSKGCLAADKNGILKIRLVTVPDANAGTSAEVCGSEFTLNAKPDMGSGKWTSSKDAIFEPSSTDPHAKIKVKESGTYKLLWTETYESCIDTASILVTFYEQPEVPEAGEDQNLNFQFNSCLNAVCPSYGKGEWSTKNKDILIQDPQSATSKIEKLPFGKSVFTWTVTNGKCQSKADTVVIEVNDLKTYTGFSPNNDGKNETFKIDGLENSVKRKLTIFNRLGEIVYSSENYNNDWDGSYKKGGSLPSDTYYYILEADYNKIYKGYFVIKR